MHKLLILGATYHEVEIVKRARAKGIYTIVTDYNTDWSQSPAKYEADEAWDVSWSDVNTLKTKCLQSNVNGVLAGFSEFRVENMIKLCAELHLPCTLTMDQLDITRDKFKFKRLCEKYNIPGVREYQPEEPKNYPVIIKPVDRAGSIGINVAYNDEEFDKYYRVALDLSPTKHVIIEDFIDDGIKVDFYYYIKDGTAYLLGTSDTIMCDGEQGAKILQKAWIFPSHYEEQYCDDTDAKVKTMLLGIGIQNGYATMSAFYRQGRFYFFEAGFRLSGELSYNYYKQHAKIHYVDTLIDYALGIPNGDMYQNCYDFSHTTHSLILNFFIYNGSVQTICKPALKDLDGLQVIADFYLKEGDTIEKSTNVFYKAAMYSLFSENQETMISALQTINSGLHIYNNSNDDLVYERVQETSFGYGCYQRVSDRNGHQVVLEPRPYWVTWKQLQQLLNKAHETNMQKGMVYATYNQSVDKLKEKCINSVVLVVWVDGELAGTCTVQFRTINHWYHQGNIGLLKLLAVLPDYRNCRLASLLTKEVLRLSQLKGVEIVVSDSAEQNKAVQRLFLSEGFSIVDCCKYVANNFVSTVYANWLTPRVPFTEEQMQTHYQEKRKSFE